MKLTIHPRFTYNPTRVLFLFNYLFLGSGLLLWFGFYIFNWKLIFIIQHILVTFSFPQFLPDPLHLNTYLIHYLSFSLTLENNQASKQKNIKNNKVK